MAESTENFHTKIQEMKHESLKNLPKEGGFPIVENTFGTQEVQDFFKDKDVNPETIAALFNATKKNCDYLEGMFPQLSFEKNSDKIMTEIREMGKPEGFKNPDELMAAIAVYIKRNMSYDLLTVLFTKPGEEDYTNKLRQTLDNPRAKFTMSSQQIANLQYFTLNLSNDPNITVRESEMLKEMSIKSWDITWLQNQVMKNTSFRNLLDKITKQNGLRLYSSEYGGILRTNERVSRNVDTMLSTVKVGVCRDFAMMSKKIYEKMAKDTFPNSEAIYVNNLAKRHAYVLLAYEKPDGKMEKHYFDPTAYITG